MFGFFLVVVMLLITGHNPFEQTISFTLKDFLVLLVIAVSTPLIGYYIGRIIRQCVT